jgi:hypothetical protein
MNNNTSIVNTESLTVKVGTKPYHSRILITAVNPFGKYLQCFSVVSSHKYNITGMGFKKGGLQAFLEDFEETPLNQSGKRMTTVTRINMLANYISRSIDAIQQEKESPIPHGHRLWSNNQLGLYFSLGVQDLETFFARGRQKRYENALIEEGAKFANDPRALAEHFEGTGV